LKKNKDKILKKRTLFHRIVNVFLYIGIIILVLFLIAFGFSQTSTFRNYLRQNIVNIANKELNGHLSIGEIDGTIFTSLILRNTKINMGSDTLLYANLIEVKTSPLQIFLKRIYVRKILISDAKIAFLADRSGNLNITKLFPPSSQDSTHSKFPFKIEVPDLNLKNINFKLQDYDNANSNQVYNNLNMHDLRINNINLSLSGSADIGKNEYELKINYFSFSPNLKNFALKNLSGEFIIDTNEVLINNLSLITDSTDLSLSARLKDFNLFDSTAFSKIDKAKLNVNLKASKFNFNDLSSFVTPLNILRGTAYINLETSGSFRELNINHLDVNYLNTSFRSKGEVSNLLDPDRMYISVSFFNSQLKQTDIHNLLPSIGIPSFKNTEIVQFDTLNFHGNPLNFNTTAFLRIGNGTAGINASLNFKKPNPVYNINLITDHFDLLPFTGITTNLTSKANIKGSGFSTQKLNSSLKFIADGSTIAGNKIDTLRFSANASNKNIKFDLLSSAATTGADLNGSFNFINQDRPTYELKGSVKNLNLADFTHDSTLKSNLNFKMDGSGDDFDIEKTSLFLTMELDKSMIKGVNINNARAIFDIRSNDNGERVINIISDLADITIIGKYSIKNSINLLSDEAGLLTNAFKAKIDSIMNPDTVFNRQLSTGVTVLQNQKPEGLMIDSASSFKYTIEFKNFDLLSLLLGSNQLSLDGDMSGEVKTDAHGIMMSVNTNLNYLKYLDAGNVFFLSNFNLGLDVSNNYDAQSLSDINCSIKLTADRIFEGSDFHNIAFNLKLTKNIASLNFSGKLKDNIATSIDGFIDLRDDIVKLNLDTLNFKYNNYSLINNGNIKINYSRDKILVDHFSLIRNNGEINIGGLLARNGNQDLKIEMKNISGSDLTANLLNVNPENSLGANIHLNAEITGSYAEPLMSLNFGADSVKFRDKVFGSLVSNLVYRNQNLSVDVKFLDSLLYKDMPALQISGNVPIDLAFSGVKERFKKSEPIDLTLNAKEFDLGTLGNIVPKISQLTGRLIANVRLTGTPSSLDPSGQIEVKNLGFRVDVNNLLYTAGIKLKIENHKISIDSLLVANAPGTKGGGIITGSGSINLKNFEIASMNANVRGSLKILSEDSKAVSPSLYGDLVIQTDNQITYTMDSKGSFVNVPIIVKEAKLTFPPTQSTYQNSADNFVYRYVVDSSKINKSELDFERLIDLSKKMNAENSEEAKEQTSTLGYSVNIKVQNEATIKFVLSREFNQNLTAVIQGNLQYDNVEGRSNAQGELKLLDGSTLEFFKTFEATGSIRFESQMNNPNLNILATYKNYYTPPDQNKEEPVEVTIKLSGPLKDLSKNLTQGKNNINVYVGSEDIANNRPDPTKDVTSAMFFVLTGKFDLTDQQSQASNNSANALSGITSSTTTSFAGSLIGGVLNHYLGDYVRGVELRSVGSTTKFNLVGKVKNFRYSIGGSTDVFQDFSQANVMIEYPIIKNLLLRLERKEGITQTSVSNQMINELGLKYRFEF
jgi:hypothetical protein